MSAYQFCRRNRVAHVGGGVIALNACKKYIIRIQIWDLVPSGTHSWRHPACESVYTSFIFSVFFASFFDEKIKDPYKDVRSAALEVVANNWKSIYSAEICCFQIFHRFALKYAKGHTMLRWSASEFFITSRQNVEKCIQCWDQPLPNLSLGHAWDIGKSIVFQGKRIDFRITGILENLWFSTKKQQTIFRTKTTWQIATDVHKKSEKCEASRNYENVFFVGKKNTKERQEGERGGRQEQQRERREQKSKARPYTRPNSRSPASGGNYW